MPCDPVRGLVQVRGGQFRIRGGQLAGHRRARRGDCLGKGERGYGYW